MHCSEYALASICSKFCLTVIIEIFEFCYSLFSGMCKFESLDLDICFRFEVVRNRSLQTDFRIIVFSHATWLEKILNCYNCNLGKHRLFYTVSLHCSEYALVCMSLFRAATKECSFVSVSSSDVFLLFCFSIRKISISICDSHKCKCFRGQL